MSNKKLTLIGLAVVSVLFAYLGYLLVPLDHHLIEALINFQYSLESNVRHGLRHPLYYSSLSWLIPYSPFSGWVTLGVIQSAFIAATLISLWSLIRQHLKEVRDQILFFLLFALGIPLLTYNFLRWEDNCSFYWLWILLIHEFTAEPFSNKNQLRAILWLSLASLLYSLFVWFSLLGLIFLLLKPRTSSKVYFGLGLLLLPLLIYQLIGAGLMGGLSYFSGKDLSSAAQASQLGLRYIDIWNGWSGMFLDSIPVLCGFLILSGVSLFYFRTTPLGFGALCVIALGLCLALNPNSSEKWTLVGILCWAWWMFAYVHLNSRRKILFQYLSLLLILSSLWTLTLKQTEPPYYSHCQMRLFEEYRQEKSQIPSYTINYVFPVAYLKIANLILLDLPRAKNGIYFTADQTQFYRPVAALFETDLFQKDSYVDDHHINDPNNLDIGLSDEDFSKIENLLKTEFAVDENTFLSSKLKASFGPECELGSN